MTDEPVLTFGTLGALIGAVLAALLIEFTGMSDPTIEAISALIVFLVPFIASLFVARSKVTPMAKLEKEKSDGNA